jgi:hypothetical protein
MVGRVDETARSIPYASATASAVAADRILMFITILKTADSESAFNEIHFKISALKIH